MKKHILNKVENFFSNIDEREDESISIKEFLIEYDYATKYLSRILKVRAFVMYLLLFKKAYFTEGNRKIAIKLSELGKNLLSDIGKPMSHDVVKRGINDLVKLGVVEKIPSKPGQINEYIVKLPSEIRQVKEFIELDENTDEEIYDDSRDDFYTKKSNRLEILKRDEYKCFYCLCDLEQNDFYLDHIFPRSNGGHDWKSNLVSACRTCNTKKSVDDVDSFLMSNYRKGLMLQTEYLQQKNKLDEMKSQYQEIKETTANK